MAERILPASQSASAPKTARKTAMARQKKVGDRTGDRRREGSFAFTPKNKSSLTFVFCMRKIKIIVWCHKEQEERVDTMGKRIVIALGGNALGNTLSEQMTAAKDTARAIADLIEAGHEVIVSHGNGPQVGMLHYAVNELTHAAEQDFPVIPLSVCVAMSQSYIGYDLQNAMREELLRRGIPKPCATVITQVVVDPHDPAFRRPSKPIGRFMSKEEAQRLQREKKYTMMEDAGRGWRRVVASPKPLEVVEIDTVRTLFEAGQVVIAAGGGGIPVIRQGNELHGVSAVVDKDFTSALIAQQVDADMLIILTAVEQCAIRFGKPDQKWLDTMSIAEAKRYCAAGEFAAGSMLPKVQAAVKFVASAPERTALITLLAKAREGIEGKTGTRIINKIGC